MSPENHAIDILGLGCAAVDELLHIERYPAADSKTEVIDRHKQCGGLTAAALIAAAKLGARCAYAGSLGANAESDFVRHCLTAAGVGLQHVFWQPLARPIHASIVIDSVDATRTIFFDVSGCLPLPPDWPSESILRGCRAILVDHFNVQAQTRAARLARSCGIPVIADFEEYNRDIEELMSVVDHLILPQKLAQQVTGCRDPAEASLALWRDGRKLSAVTCGAEGCWFTTDASEQENIGSRPLPEHQPAFEIRAVDTTGCGDVFHGAYAFALVRGDSVVSALRFAAAAAALKATCFGGAAETPDASRVMSFLKETGQCISTN